MTLLTFLSTFQKPLCLTIWKKDGIRGSGLLKRLKGLPILSNHQKNQSYQLSELFTRFMSATVLSKTSDAMVVTAEHIASPPKTYQEVLDFLISRPTSQEIIGFKVSEQSQTRLQTLLQKNRDAGLSLEEKSELDLYEQLDTLMGLLKARAFVTLKPATES